MTEPASRRQATGEAVRLVARAMALVARTWPAGAAVSLALVLVNAVAPVVQVGLAKLVVDRLASGADGAVALAGVYALTLLIPAVSDPVGRLLDAGLEERAVGEIDRRLLATGTRLVDLDRLERPEFHDDLRVMLDFSSLPPRSLLLLGRALGTPLTLAGLLVLLGGLHPLLPVVLLAVTVPQIRSQASLSALIHRGTVRAGRAYREMEYCTRLATEPAGAKEVRVFGLGGFLLDRYRDRRKEAVTEVQRLRLTEVAKASWFAGVRAVVLAGGFVYVATRAGAGELTLGDVALYVNAIAQAEGHTWDLSYSWDYVHRLVLGLRTLFPFLDRAGPAIAVAPPGEGLPASERVDRGIELRAVTFAYPGRPEPVLADVTATLPAGRVTALVGDNGAGKSTLVKLLTRMYDPGRGEILVDGHTLAGFDLTSWRDRVAVVHQDFARFALSLDDNVALGRHRQGEDPDVAGALAWAGADAMAARLPQGRATQLTRHFDGGVDLSGGEWQKVALARGYVRRDAALVILDEPTATLDAEAEERLFRRFQELVAGRTGLLISHRFSTVRMADHILVLGAGRITEAGSHDELVTQGGRYAELFEMQAARYR